MTDIRFSKIDFRFMNCNKLNSRVKRVHLALVLRLLHIEELRKLQTEANRVIVETQSLTANPITDTSLGKVGRGWEWRMFSVYDYYYTYLWRAIDLFIRIRVRGLNLSYIQFHSSLECFALQIARRCSNRHAPLRNAESWSGSDTGAQRYTHRLLWLLRLRFL